MNTHAHAHAANRAWACLPHRLCNAPDPATTTPLTARLQPVAVGICASPAMQFYSGGVIDTCCNDLNHGVLVVGYGSDPATNSDYWLVKNSW